MYVCAGVCNCLCVCMLLCVRVCVRVCVLVCVRALVTCLTKPYKSFALLQAKEVSMLNYIGRARPVW